MRAFNPAAPIYFDHNADGIRTGTGWINSDDGFLVFDRKGNGTIDSGRELFGDADLSRDFRPRREFEKIAPRNERGSDEEESIQR